MSWTLQVLGNITLYDAAKTLKPERRMVALLTYLALEGSTPRPKLAALLWPDSDDRTARNNLVQTLRRLKKATGTDLVTGEDALKLSDVLEVDIAKLNVLAFQGHYQELLKSSGDLLPYDYDDVPEFSDWLFLEREKLSNLRREALSKLVEKFERENDYGAALNYAATLLQLDPINEETYRLLMRLHYLSGNRSESLKMFEKCKTVLQTELGIEPLLETQQLAADIGIGLLEPSRPSVQKITIPLSVLRPPVLVGREKEWELLEFASSEGKIIFIHGEPGSGKSRLMLDFVTSKGDYSLVDPRPGDEAVSYSTHARNVRRFLEKFPQEKLEPWVRTELSRLVPELSTEPPPPMQSETDKLRLFEAVTWLTLRHHALGAKAIVTDDMQFIDAGSLEMSNFLIGKYAPATTLGGLRSINAYRTGEISAQTETMIHNLVNAGTAVLIEIKPLARDEVAELVESLAIPHFRDLTERLSNYTGGNPFFILETLKSLLESGSDDPSRFPVSSRVGVLIQKRLDKLHPTSLKLARVAAVASTDFSPGLAETILSMDALELAEPFAELEQLQVLRGTAFAHDLIYEATLSGLPAPIKTLLHGRVAGWLDASNANPARIAQHYLEAGEEAKATPFLLEAARQQRANFRYIEAVGLFDSAIHILEKQGDVVAVFETLYEQGKIIGGVDLSAKRETISQKLFSLANSPEQHAKACEYAARYYLDKGHTDQLERVSQQGYGYALTSKNLVLQVFFSKMFARVHWHRGQMQQGIDLLKPALQLAKNHGQDYEVADISYTIGILLCDINPCAEADAYFRDAQAIFEKQGNIPELVSVISFRANMKAVLGLLRGPLELNARALELLDKTSGSLDIRMFLEISRATYLHNREEYAKSLDIWLRLQRSTLADYGQSIYIGRELALLYLCLGELEQSRKLLQQALESTFAQHYVETQYYYLYFLLATNGYNGELDSLEQPDKETYTYMYWLARYTKVNKSLQAADEWLSIARDRKLPGEVIYALCVCAALNLESHPTKALEYTTEMLHLMETYAAGVYKGELLLTHYQALKACQDKTAKDYLKQTLAWLMDLADNKVPSEYRESFLNNNLVNKAILEAAKQAGLGLPQVS